MQANAPCCAVENGAGVARSAATGISAFRHPQGQILQPIALDQVGYRVAAIPRAVTPRFTGSMANGWPGLLLLLLVILVVKAIFGPKALSNLQKHWK